MRKRVASWTLAGLFVLSCLTFGTARARQVADVNDAQHHFALVRADTYRMLSSASRDGMTARELRPYQQRATRLDRTPRPGAMPLWDPSGARFYDRQSVSYRRLVSAIRAGETRLTLAAKSQVSASLDLLSRDIGTASSLDLDAGAARAALTAQTAALAASKTLRDVRAVGASVDGARAALAAPLQARLKVVHAVIAQAGGSVAGVQALADSEVQASQQKLSLLGLLTPRAQAYSAALDRLKADVHAQTTVFAAAVKIGAVQLEADKVAADYARTIPVKMVVVSTEDQHAVMYDRSNVVYSTDVTTGGPELPTDHGVFHIYFKASPFTFHSPWPVGSPYYYNPTPVQYWMPFDGAEGLHDASWRSNFGPGSNLAPTDLGTGNTILGTHGCVNLPFAAAQFVWDWAPVGTTVVVI